MVFFHKYFLFKKVFNHDFTKYLTCCCCVFLSLKVCNLLVPLEDLIILFLKIYYKEKFSRFNINDNTLASLKLKVTQIEFDILDCIGFDLNVDLPYMYIPLMKSYFLATFNEEINKKIILIITSFINDSFKLPLCLYYEPLLIFLASLNLINSYFGLELKDLDNTKWYHLIHHNVKLEVIQEISQKIKLIYDYSNNSNASINLAQNKNSIPPITSNNNSINAKNPANPINNTPTHQKKYIIDFEPYKQDIHMEDFSKASDLNADQSQNSLEIHDNKISNLNFGEKKEISQAFSYTITSQQENSSGKNTYNLKAAFGKDPTIHKDDNNYIKSNPNKPKQQIEQIIHKAKPTKEFKTENFVNIDEDKIYFQNEKNKLNDKKFFLNELNEINKNGIHQNN